MKFSRWQRYFFITVRAVWLAAIAGFLPGEQLPVRRYTVAEGLPIDQVLIIRQDSRRLLWFGTSDGLAWFDGSNFKCLTTDDGLPHRFVPDILETRAGEIWLATANGLCRFNGDPMASPGGEPRPRIEVFHPRPGETDASSIQCLLEAPDGSLWVGTGWGLFHFARQAGKWQFKEIDIGLKPRRIGYSRSINQLLSDRSGSLWIAFDSGLIRRLPDGRVFHYGPARGLPAGSYFTLALDSRGWVWMGSNQGIYAVDPESPPAAPAIVWRMNSGAGTAGVWVRALLAASDGRVWAASASGLTVMDPGRGPAFSRTFTKENGLVDQNLFCLMEDDERNVWIGTETCGALRISPRGFQLFDRTDGLTMNHCQAIFADRPGNLGFFNRELKTAFFGFDGNRFFPVPLPGTEEITWTDKQLMQQDQRGEWWLATGDKGLWRYAKSATLAGLAGRRPVKIYGEPDGLPGNQVFSVFEDSRGDIWAGVFSLKATLVRWDRRENRFIQYPRARHLPICFQEDRSGAVWAGLYGDGVLRLRPDRIESFPPRDGAPEGLISCLHADRQGRLWIGSVTDGVARVDDPAAARPVFRRYTKKNGFSSNNIRSIEEDRWGRLYFTTSHGVDRLDPATGAIKHFGAADGLSSSFAMVSRMDREGNLWVGSYHGIFRYVPGPDIIRKPPAILVTALRIGGNAHPLAAWGQREVGPLVVPPGQSRLEIEFSGISFAPGDRLGYRYRLAGLDDRWHQISTRRVVDYMNIRPGNYRFFVQAVNSEGTASLLPATVSFTVLAPVWMRWWFIALVLLAVVGGIYAVVRIKVTRRLELERVRTRIATDLHDDIGSSLSQISILSEVTLRHPGVQDQTIQIPLARIAASARELVDGMSDIVWAINPKRDRLGDLVFRMRQFASDLFAEGDITHTFQAPGGEVRIPLGADFRRHFYLIFKECLHNLVRHAQATEADITVRFQGGWLEMEIRDNGRGFDPAGSRREGHGLESMRSRARELGGVLSIGSVIGKGTRIRLRVPVIRLFPRPPRRRR